MEKINNEETIKECSRVLGHQVDRIPELDTTKIVLVANINPKHGRRSDIVRSTSSTTTNGATIYTTPTDKDFYFVGGSLSYQADATSDGILVEMRVTPFGATSTNSAVLKIAKQATTAGQGSVSISLPNPIRLQRGSTITATHTFTVGTQTITGSIIGYTTDIAN